MSPTPAPDGGTLADTIDGLSELLAYFEDREDINNNGGPNWEMCQVLLLRDAIRLVRDGERMRGELRGLISHWDEFGPEHGFDERIDLARKVVTP